jgi:hypothetical protein
MSRFIFRGGLGGLIGTPLFLIGQMLHDKLRMGYVPYGGAFQIMAAPYVVIIGIILGSLVGCLMWLLRAKAGIDLSTVVRAITGAGFILFLSALREIIAGEDDSGLIPPTPLELLINEAMFLTFFGSLPGILASPAGSESLYPAKLSKWRNCELNYGLATSLVAICLFVLVPTSPIMEGTLYSIWGVLVPLLLFAIPGGLVGFGSYTHAARRRFWGWVMLLIGFALVLAFSIFLFVILPLYRISTEPILCLSFVLLASLTFLFSLLARKE